MPVSTSIRRKSTKVYLEPGDATTCTVGASAVTFGRFVAITTGGKGNHPRVVHAAAAGPKYGVAHYSMEAGGEVSVLRAGTVGVEAGAALTSGQEVEVGTGGVAVVAASGRRAGVCTADTAQGALAPITLYEA